MATRDELKSEMEQIQKIIVIQKDNVKGLKEKIQDLTLGIFQKLTGCTELKDKLYRLLNAIQLKLQVATRIIREKLNSFKFNQQMRIRISKFIEDIKRWTPQILGISGVVSVVCFGILGIQPTFLISALAQTTIFTMRNILIGFGVLGAVGVTFCVIKHLYQAYTNKQVLVKSISACEDALKKLNS